MIRKSFNSFAPTRFRIAKCFLLGTVLLVVTGFVYERIGEWRDHKRFLPVGRSVDVGGRTLNISCSGEGTPTVVLESNLGSSGYRRSRSRSLINF